MKTELPIALRKLLTENRGAASTEYALFLALVIGAATFGADLLGLTVRQAFAETAESLRKDGAAVTVAAVQPMEEAVPVAPAPVAPAPLTEEAIAANDAWIQQLQLCVIAVALVGGGVVYYFLYVRGNKKRKEEAERFERKLKADEGMNEAIFRKRQEILRTFEADLQKLLSSNVQVGHIMSRNVTTVAPHTKVDEVREVMQSHHMRHVLVVDPARRLLGVISDRDLSGKDATTAAQLMTAKPFTVAPSSPLSPAITLLVNEGISCLPVVQGDKLVGIFTTTDVLVTLQCALQTLQKASHEAAHAHEASDATTNVTEPAAV